jgi:hypothetical protein
VQDSSNPDTSAPGGRRLVDIRLMPYSALFVMLRGFYAYEDTKTPFILALWIGVANGGLAYLSYVLLGNTRWAVAGMCAAYSISYLIGLFITAVRPRSARSGRAWPTSRQMIKSKGIYTERPRFPEVPGARLHLSAVRSWDACRGLPSASCGPASCCRPLPWRLPG